MYRSHPAFVLPPRDASVWRFTTLPKLIHSLQTGRLFFSRLDAFGDPFEGSLPTGNMTWRVDEGTGWDDQEGIRGRTLVNCWHVSRYESEALWQLYARLDAPVAIKSTVGRLLDSFSEAEGPVYAALVYYLDFEFQSIDQRYEKFPFIFKRSSFAHERELRAITRVPGPPKDGGRAVKVDLNLLIQDLYVPPDSPEWFMDVVAKLLDQYEVPRVIRRSRASPYRVLSQTKAGREVGHPRTSSHLPTGKDRAEEIPSEG